MIVDKNLGAAYAKQAAKVIDGGQTMTSLQIAEVTGKRHDAVLRDIRNLLGQGVNAHNFVAVEYTDAKGEKRPCYQLTKKGCLILASGYNAVLREKIINRWEELETGKAEPLAKHNVPQTYAEALRQLADEVEAKEKTQALLAEKTEQLDESKEWFSIKRWAQIHRKNWRNYDWRKLKALSCELGYEVKKIFDANYSEVNIYHKAVFETAYGRR